MPKRNKADITSPFMVQRNREKERAEQGSRKLLYFDETRHMVKGEGISHRQPQLG